MGHFQALNPYYVLLFLCLVLDSLVLFSHGGTTSSYVRRLQATVDMALDSDVFRVSPGCDAPQQYDTKYYYMGRVGQTERKFWFCTPPKPGADVPYTFGFIGFQDTITNKTERVGNVRTRLRRSEEP
ncbi:hypothetical protein DY000_02005349 [Brassica cretica]|uniref:S-protein homolog n=1 Tax=Brassica cretica TaxID=69181 RepID=A0ABQ7C0R0_BRACR|nr:hypothetical protein DY000_02005349 [Brassica cretica]